MYAGNSKDSNIEFINIENMRKVLSIIYLIVLIVNGSYAQSSYPIYVSPALTPPYSLKLSDYSKFGSQQLVVNIAVNDLNVSNLPVKLHIKMETVGITIESLPTLNTTPIYLDGGAATILFGDDLADYFDINNLTFKGYSKEAYRRTGQLPEGFYKFTVEVLHFQTNRLISNAGTATAWISVGKPPVLKLPENDKELGEFKGMPIVFSWYASKLGNPMSAAGVQYKFEMWEMRVDGISPYTIAASVPLFHEETTSNTMVTVLPSSLLMEPGMKYAWRVTAMDVSGMVPFEQDGHSEMRVFTYKSKCNSVANLKADQHGRSGSFVWDPGSNHTSYNIELRKPATGWLSASETFDSKAEFYELDYATTYEMRVQAVCNGDPESVSDFSEWATLKIPAQRSKPDSSTCPTCGCSDSLGTGNIENLELRRDLKPGDTLSNRFGTTRFIVKSVEPQGDGVYKGHFLFWAELWKLKFVCEYWDLSVNTDNVILNMDYQSVYNPQFLLDVDATAAFLDSLAGAITDLTVSTTIKDTVTIGETISSIYVNAGDSVVAVTVDPDGTVHEVVIQTDADDIPKTIIQGENGEQFVVTGNGQVMGLDEYKHTGGNGRKLDEYKKEKEAHLSTTQVAFSASQNQTYGFDAFSEEKQALKSKYPSLQNGYTPAYKSIASYRPDKVVASSTESGITFRDEMGIPAIKTGNDLTVRGGTDGSVTALYAYKAVNDTTEEVAGKLNLMSFDEQAKKVYIIPVNGAKMPIADTLKRVLNTVYAQAVTRWEVVPVTTSVDVAFSGGQMTHGGSSAIDVYNTDQKSIIGKFKKDGNDIESDALYLFFVDNVKGKTGDIAGYMPLQKQVGFIYNNPNPYMVAHELGHGAFNLRHVFSPESFVAAQGTTKNLMDYSGSTDLWQHQWALIHDPESLWFAWAQDESEGEGIFKFTASFDKENYKSYGSLQDPRSEIPIITINYALSDTLGYKIMLIDKKEVKAIFQKQIYPIATTVKYLYEIPGNKTISVILVDKNFTPIDSTIISTTIIDSSTVAVIDGDQKIGPLDIKFDTPKTETSNGDTLICVVSKCSFTLQVNEFEFTTKMFNVTNASLVYKKIKKTNVIVGAEIVWDNSEGMDIGEVGFMSAKVTHVGISVDDQGKLKGELKFKVSLTEDYSYKDFLLIKKGLEGQFSFNYSSDNKEFLGDFNFEGLNNINMFLTKDATTRKPFAELTGGTVNKEGVLSGTFKGIENSSYKSNGFTISVNKLELVGDYNLKTGIFKPKSGEGNLTVSKIKGTKGKLLFDVKYGDVITVALDKSKSDLVISGLVAKDLDLTAIFTDKFDFQDAKGSLKLAHANYGTELNVPSFEISAGEVKTLQITGNLSYKGFVFELEKCDYSSDKGFVLSGMVKLGSENKFLAQNITIDTSGTFGCSNISGEMGIKYVNASFSAGISNTGVSGSFTAKMFGLDLNGGVDYGIATKKNTDLNYAIEKQFSYGQFSIVTSTIIPVFPGLKISKLGGKFAFNCSYDLTKHPMKLNPCYQSYVAGLSLGVGDMAGIFNFAVDPALVQFSNTNVSIFINSTLSIPASKPMFIGKAELLLQYPSGNISGKVSATVRIPDSNGWIVKTIGENQVNFVKDEGHTRIYTTSSGFHAKVLNSLDLTGSIDYIKNYNESGSVTSTSGEIKGNIRYNFYESVHLSFGPFDAVKIDGSLKIDFNANMSMIFNENGSSGTFSGNLIIEPKAQMTVVGGTFWAEGYFNGAANVSYTNTAANLKAAYIIDLKCSGGFSYSTSGTIDKTIPH